ncbi:hypothetical protein DZA37_00930 [Kangiella sp. HD9-110m-PIT-SAG06]|nr:hypothetical protein DZA37_00930 [Kangiella sp. HD9-110m-PIT-SAG06]
MLKFLVVLTLLTVTACSPEVTREDRIQNVRAYYSFYSEASVSEGQYAFWFEDKLENEDYRLWEKQILFDSEKLEGVLNTPVDTSFQSQFIKLVGDNPSISYAEAVKKIKVNRFYFDKESCPEIAGFADRFKKAQYKKVDPNPPYAILLEQKKVSFHSGEMIVDGKLVGYSNFTTLSSGNLDEPMIREFLELLTVIQACKNQTSDIN